MIGIREDGSYVRAPHEVSPEKSVLHEISLCDATMHGSYDKIRRLCYPETDLFLLCYGYDSRVNSINATHHHHPLSAMFTSQ
eukprot:TRINITY_DN2813_c0_g1_i3.p1 TRINITY_DN2813_c0_g1~~TRINITY_DN2813_c0_g1_i3.p1  ORF type:complete len:82 (+),score=9.67 TRINITY_DN2813_c0_g1_i3:314-559(+)